MTVCNQRSPIRVTTVLGVLLFASVGARAALDPAAPTIYLKQSCATTPDNCFIDAATMLTWVWSTRNPSAQAPLLIEIDPGSYPMPAWTCSIKQPQQVTDRGHTTFRGAGRQNTVLLGSASSFLAAVAIEQCSDLVFEDLTVDGVPTGDFGVEWLEGGNSVWSNVAVRGVGFGWYDASEGVNLTGCSVGSPGRHEWYGSAIRVEAPAYGIEIAYQASCGDSWFWGSEIVAQTSGVASKSSFIGVRANSPSGSVHLFGTDVRVIATATASNADEQVGLTSLDGGVIHHHGGEVVVRHENSANNQTVVGIWADGAGSLVHALETSFGVLPGGSNKAVRARVTNGGRVDSAFQWVAGIGAPMPGDGSKHLKSLDGQDSYVEIDCPLLTGCQDAGSYPHLMIYSSACTGTDVSQGPWFDTVTRNCRGL